MHLFPVTAYLDAFSVSKVSIADIYVNIKIKYLLQEAIAEMTSWSREQLVDLNLDAFLSLYKVSTFQLNSVMVIVTASIIRRMSFPLSLGGT